MINKDIKEVFDRFSGLNILIIGDVMVDSYVIGSVNRISPEAPVPVVSVSKRYNRLGGAANVALNVKSLGANAFLCSVIGNDTRGNDFTNLMQKRNLPAVGIIKSNNRVTTTKFRVIGNNSQMLRVDEEDTMPLNREDFDNLKLAIDKILTFSKIDAVIFEDYDKGVIDKRLIDFITERSKSHGFIVTADPKKENFGDYCNLTLFKPNLKELSEGTNTNLINGNIEEINAASQQIINKQNLKSVMVTLSEHGIFGIDNNGDFHIPAEVRNIADVSGAGDTVISTVTLALAAGMKLPEAARLANIAGGLVCEEVGVVPIDKEKLLLESLKLMQ